MTAWWEAKGHELFDLATQFAIGLRDRQYRTARGRAEAALFLYRGSRRLRLSGSEGGWLGRDLDETPPHNNIIATSVDWFTSIMVRNRIRPFFLTQKGNAEDRRKADIRQRATEGTMTQLGIYGELGALRSRDGHLFRAGGVKYAADFQNQRVLASRVRPWEVFTPERESRLGFPRQLVHSQLVPKEVLLSMFPDDSAEWRLIHQAEPEDLDPREQMREDFSEMLLVNELWHLPSGRVDFDDPASWGLDDNHEEDGSADAGHDGRRVLCLRNGIIKANPWPFPYFPIAWYRPFREPVGYWSQGIPEMIGGAQVVLLEIAEAELKYLNRHAVPHLLVWDKARLNPYAMSNDDAKVWSSRVPPSQAAMYLNTNAAPAELLNYKQWVLDTCKERLGVTNMQLFGQKPPGVDHQPGMDHLSEMNEIRQTAAYQAWERAHIDDATIISDCYYQLAQVNDDFEVVFGDAKDLVRNSYKDMDLRREAFTTTCYPTNAFAQTPQAKFRQVKEWMQAGLFNDTPQARLGLRVMSGAPDTDALAGDSISMEQNIERCLTAAQKGEPDVEWIPQPWMDLELCKTKGRERINRLEADGEEEDAIDRVERFVELASELSRSPAAAPVAGPTTPVAPVQPGGAPQGAPNQIQPGAPPM